MTNHKSNVADSLLTRRELLHACGMGFGALAFAQLIDQTALADEKRLANPFAPKPPHFTPKAKRLIHLFMNGGPSQVDTFDPKPMLDQYHGKPLPIHLKTERKTGVGFASPFKFQKHGQSGIEVSELYPNVAKHVDDLCIIRSMRTDLPNHEPSLLMMNCGDLRQIRPSLGAWLTYGLGTENQNLPGFVVLCPYGYPVSGTQNWTAGFLPSIYQATYIDSKETEVERLIERGVRFVQVWQGKDQPWDNHETLQSSHRQLAQATDQAIAALLADLKQRGMLDDTLVIWGGEFGRTPVVELTGSSGGANRDDWGRDHNNHGFTMWLAGGGVKKGFVHGATDEFGFAAVENPLHVHDLHATILHLLGFDHERLTYRYAGRDFRLTDVHGVVAKELIA